MRSHGDILGVVSSSRERAVDFRQEFNLMRGAGSTRGRNDWLYFGGDDSAIGVEKDSRGYGSGHWDKESGIACVVDGRIVYPGSGAGTNLSRFGFRSPAALMIESYLARGVSFLDEMSGEYSVALWDMRRRILLLARDPMGLRPLYYFRKSDVWGFSSDVASLRRCSLVSNALDTGRIYSFVGMQHEEDDATFFKDVKRIPAGHRLLVTPEGVGVKRYWAGDKYRDRRWSNVQEAAGELLGVFSGSVVSRVSYGRPAFMLSGGLDSSSIVVVARDFMTKQGRGPVSTYSGVFPELAKRYERIDELRWMNAVVGQGDVDANFVDMEGVDPLESAFWDSDEPYTHPNLYLEAEIFKAAGRSGFDSVFSGFDGDTTIGFGVDRLSDLFLRFRWLRLHKEILAVRQGMHGLSYRVLLMHCAVLPSLPRGLLRAMRRMKRRVVGSEFPLPGLIGRDFAEACDYKKRLEASWEADYLRRPKKGDGVFDAVTASMLDRGIELLEKVARHTGVRCQLPFMDSRVVELAASFPNEFKLSSGVNRVVMREAMRGLLPEEVRVRTSKQNIAPNVLLALHKRCLERMGSVVLSGTSSIAEYYDMNALSRCFHDFSNDPLQVPHLDVMALFNATCLGLWLDSRAARA